RRGARRVGPRVLRGLPAFAPRAHPGQVRHLTADGGSASFPRSRWPTVLADPSRPGRRVRHAPPGAGPGRDVVALRAMTSGYLHPRYAESHRAYGTPRELPNAGAWIIERAVPGFPDRDAMGCYP